jgi:hypothetical protein
MYVAVKNVKDLSFFSFELTGSDAGKKKNMLYKELLLALVASVFLGFGVLFLLLWTGVYI